MRRPSPQRGYNLVMLMVAITVLNIMVAVSLPMWSQEIQREKEEELISRGFQYVEAIRVFQNRFQRMPVRLEELLEVKPRCIRRLWKDPMTDGSFQPIFQNEGQALTPPPGTGQGDGGQGTGGIDGKPGNGRSGTGKPGDAKGGGKPGSGSGTGTGNGGQVDPDDQGHIPTDSNGNPLGVGPDGQPVTVGGPIVGVRSRSKKKSVLVFAGKEHYDEWRFTIDLMLQGARPAQPPAPGQVPPPTAPGAGLQLSTRWIGRPLPFTSTGILPQPGDMMPGGSSNPPNPTPPSGRRPPGGLGRKL
jgi:type II secretory pathway pseudopilin PulG